MTGPTVCYSCGLYSYQGRRHDACPPRYRRARLRPCDRCGRMSLGKRHRLCGDKPALPCGYCGERTVGAFHNRCAPIGVGSLAVFPDMPMVVQRRCADCQEWYPFASLDGAVVGTSDAWRPGRTPNGRSAFSARCRACIAEQRRRVRSPRAPRLTYYDATGRKAVAA